jgi:hypothetical protein
MARKIVLIATVVAAALTLTSCGGSGRHAGSITELAPTVGEVEGWAPAGTAEVFAGEDLFELINGGAEIYHEFGFERVLSQDYAGAEQRSIALEVFEMEDAAAAYGLYSFKSSGRGRPLELGDDGMLEDYYLNFRKGRFVVTLTGMNTDEGTVRGLVPIGRAVAEKIRERGDVPAIVTDLTAGGGKPGTPFYLRGELALANVAPFAVGVRFGMTEGAAIRFDDHTEIVLRFTNANRARQTLETVVEELGARSGWTTAGDVDDGSVVLAGEGGGRVRLALADEKILVVVSEDGIDTKATMSQLVARVTGVTAEGEGQ